MFTPCFNILLVFYLPESMYCFVLLYIPMNCLLLFNFMYQYIVYFVYVCLTSWFNIHECIYITFLHKTYCLIVLSSCNYILCLFVFTFIYTHYCLHVFNFIYQSIVNSLLTSCINGLFML